MRLAGGKFVLRRRDASGCRPPQVFRANPLLGIVTKFLYRTAAWVSLRIERSILSKRLLSPTHSS